MNLVYKLGDEIVERGELDDASRMMKKHLLGNAALIPVRIRCDITVIDNEIF